MSNMVISLFFTILFVVVVITLLSLSSRVTAHRAEHAFQSDNLVAAVQGYDRAVREAPFDRALLIRFLETTLLAREEIGQRIPSPLGGGLGRGGQVISQKEAIDAALMQYFQNLHRLTSNEDPLLPSLEAWHAAVRGEKKKALGFLEEATLRAPFSIPRLRIAVHVAHLLNDRTLEEALRVELLGLLPPWWHNPQDPRHRILLKENPWLRELLL